MAAKDNPNELYLTRVYDAPVKAVWEAWTDPVQLAKWYGPRGFTHTTKSREMKPGGKWIFTMHGPDGKDWPNITVYHEVEPHKKLVYDHGATETTPPLFRVTILFSEKAGKTTMDFTMTFASRRPRVKRPNLSRPPVEMALGTAWPNISKKKNPDATSLWSIDPSPPTLRPCTTCGQNLSTSKSGCPPRE